MPPEGVTVDTQNAQVAQSEDAATVIENQPPEQVADSIRAGYDRIANPDKVENDDKPTAEEQPPTNVLSNDQAKELLAQVSRIPELEKQLRDAGGRYGALKQSLEQLQQRIESSRTAGDTVANSQDAKELLADLWEEFPEIAEKLHGAFSKVMSAGGSIDPDSIKKMVAEGIEQERESNIRTAMQELTDAHPDWMQVRETPEFEEWKKTLTPRALSRFNKSQDPEYVAEKLDEFKEWRSKLSTRQEHTTPEQTTSATTHASRQRLANAVLPTTSTRQAPKGEPDPKSSIRAGYERVARMRLR